MGLSTKQVSSDGLDWIHALLQEQSFELKDQSFEKKEQCFEMKDQSFELKERSFELPKQPTSSRRQQQQLQNPQQEQLKCPRCESTNTKFCYYNNYNQTQPRHFCRACKRHWTKGGTLRNVPVGGHSRKNKRTKKLHSSSSSASKTLTNCAASNVTTATINNTSLAFDQTNSFRRLNDHHLAVDGEQRLNAHMGVLSQQGFITSSEMGNHTTMSFNFLQASRAQVPSFPFSNSSTTSSSFASFQSPNDYNYSQDQFKSMEPSTSVGLYTSNDWNWEDIETLVSTDLNVTWDDSDMNHPK